MTFFEYPIFKTPYQSVALNTLVPTSAHHPQHKDFPHNLHTRLHISVGGRSASTHTRHSISVIVLMSITLRTLLSTVHPSYAEVLFLVRPTNSAAAHSPHTTQHHTKNAEAIITPCLALALYVCLSPPHPLNHITTLAIYVIRQHHLTASPHDRTHNGK